MLKYNEKLRILICLAVLALIVTAMAGCGNKDKETEKTTKAAESLSADYKLSIEESGWCISKYDNCLYYAFALKNCSNTGRCDNPSVKVSLINENGEKYDEEIIAVPGIEPGKTVYFGTVGIEADLAPAEIRFKEMGKEASWTEAGNYKDTESLSVENVTAGEPVVTDSIGKEMNFDREFKDFEEITGEKAEVKEKDITDEDGYDKLEHIDVTTEFCGRIVNPNNDKYKDILVSIIYRDGNGDMIGGENMTLDEISSKGTESFEIVSSSGIPIGNYEVFAYPW